MWSSVGLTLMFQSHERRRTLALYTLARLMQCMYNSLKARGAWHFWGSDWAYGDALLFAFSSAQVCVCAGVFGLRHTFATLS